eukprot:s354_g17.t1
MRAMSVHIRSPYCFQISQRTASGQGWSLDDSEELLQVPSDELQPLAAVPLEIEESDVPHWHIEGESS